MQVVELMHTRVRKALGEIHVTRLRSLFAAVGGLLLGQQLWLSSVGRNLATKTAEKYQIKRVDRLLGNGQLQVERPAFYRWLSSLMLSPGSQPCVLVDWSDIDTTKSLFLLRAAVSVGGRALTVYEAVYDRYANRQDMEKSLALRIRTGYGPENVSRLRRFALGAIQFISDGKSSVAEKMRQLHRNTRLVFDYLRMTKNSIRPQTL